MRTLKTSRCIKGSALAQDNSIVMVEEKVKAVVLVGLMREADVLIVRIAREWMKSLILS